MVINAEFYGRQIREYTGPEIELDQLGNPRAWEHKKTTFKEREFQAIFGKVLPIRGAHKQKIAIHSEGYLTILGEEKQPVPLLKLLPGQIVTIDEHCQLESPISRDEAPLIIELLTSE